MDSLAKDSTVPNAKKVPETGNSYAMLEITHVVPIDIIAPMPVIENVPIEEPNPKLVPQSSMEVEARSPPKEKTTKAKKRRVSRKVTAIISNSESFDEPPPNPKPKRGGLLKIPLQRHPLQ